MPQPAWAQNILGIVIAFSLIPLVNGVLAVVFAVVSRSGRVFLLHSGLVIVWLVFFWFFSSYTGSDLLAWLPIYLSVGHSSFLVFFSVRRASRGGKGSNKSNI